MLNNFFKQSNFDRYVAYLKSTSLSDASLKRKLSSLTSFQNFLIKKKLIDPPQFLTLPPHSVVKSKFSLTKFISSIRQRVALPKSFVTYLIISSLLIIAAGTGYTLYRQAITKARLNLAYTTAGSPVYGNRFLSFQGRLTDSSGNPISSPTTIGMVFELFNTPNLGEGTTLYTSATGNSQVVSPDDNGIFSVTIGKSHGTTIPDSVFTQNSSVYLQITAGGEVMDPRQPIATVGYAINSESLQGLPPSASGLKDTVLVIDSNGDLNLGETSPTIKSTSGTLGIEGQAILIKATNGLDTSNIKIDPVNSNGAIQFNTVGDGSSNAIVATNSNLSTGNLFFGQIGNDNRGYNFIDFQNFNVGTSTYASRFSVSASGNVNVGGTLNTANISIGNTFLTATAANLNLLTGLTPSSGSIIYSTSTNLATSSVGSSGQLLVSNGTAPPTWIDSSSIGQIYTASTGITLVGSDIRLNLGSSNVWLAKQTFASDIGISNQLYVGTGFTGAPGQVLTSTGIGLSWTTPSGTTYTATNGLNLNGAAFGLGGLLTQNTSIGLSSFSLSFEGLGGTQSLFLASNGYVGIGTTNPTAPLEIGGVAGEIVTSSGDLTLSAGSSNVSFNNNNLININQLFASGGIGVTGDSYFTDDITAQSGNFYDNVNLYFQNQTNYSDGLRVYKRGNVSDINGNVLNGGEIGYHSFYGWNGSAYQRSAYVLTKASEDWSGSANGTEYYIYTSSTGTTTPAKRFAINRNGNIAITGTLGIGVTNTSSSLEVNKNGGGDIMFVNNNVTTTAGDLLGEIKFRTDDDSTSGNLVKAYIKAVAETTFTSSNHRAMLNFGTGLGTSAATTQMTLSSDGYLGLGTTAPTQRLDIAGSMKLSGQMYVGTGFTGAPGQVLTSNGVGLSWTTPTGTTYTASNGLTLNGTAFGLGGTLTQNTNIGISSFSLSFQGLGGTQSLYLASSGFVGIGTTNPTLAKLQFGYSSGSGNSITIKPDNNDISTKTYTLLSGTWVENDVDFYSASSKELYIGFSSPFSGVYFDLGTTATYNQYKASFYLEYYDGSGWNYHLPFFDESNGFTNDGKIYFKQPKDWTTNTLTPDSTPRYWLKISCGDGCSQFINRPTLNSLPSALKIIQGNAFEVYSTSLETEPSLAIDKNGNITIGGSGPAPIDDTISRLYIKNSSNDEYSSNVGIYQDIITYGRYTESTGILNRFVLSNDNNEQYITGFSNYSDTTNTNTNSYQTGLYNDLSGNALHGVVNNLNSLNDSSTFSYVYGLENYIYTFGEDTGYGIYNQSTANHTSTQFGLYNVMSGASTEKWGIYSTGEDKNYFSGNLGLGTTAPTQRLDIAGSMKLSGQMYVDTGFTGAPGQVLTSTGVGLSWTTPTGTTYTATNGLNLNGSAFGLGGTLTQNTNIGISSFSLSFQGLGDTQSLYLASSGFVGIGITAPQALLHVGSSSSRTPLWIAGGQGGYALASSQDGITWSGINTSALDVVIGVAWNGTRWVAVGLGSSDTIAYSDDGLNWTGVGGTLFTTGYNVAWNGTRWVAVGGDYSGNSPNTIAYSNDGITWTGIGTSIFSQFGVSVAWNGTRFVAVGAGSSNSIAYSSDGINWTGVGTSIFDAIGAGVAWNGTRFVAVGAGSSNSIAYSSDGINWTGIGTSIFDQMGIGVAWNGTRFVAMGSGDTNTIAYSSDGISWTGIGNSIFTASGWGVAWNGTRFVATGDGLNGSLAYSSDGINWNMSPSTGLFTMQGMGVASAPAPQLIPAQLGVPINISAIFDSNVSIGTTANNYKLNIDGDINITGNYRVNGTPFANFWTASGNNIYNNNLGNVGIGNTDPQYKLDIEVGEDDIHIGGNGTNGTGIFFTNRDTTTQQWYMAVNGTSTSRGTAKSFFIQNRDTYETNFLIDPSGNVGIGVETPSKRLDVGGDIKLTGQLYVGTGFTGAPGQVLVSTGVGLSWGTVASSSSSSNLPFSTFYGFDSYVNSLGGFGTGGVQRITKTGNLVNIGTIQANQLNIASGGTFSAGITYPAFANTRSPYALTLNDFNGDNKPDVAIINNHGGGDNDSITVKFNNGDGTFDVGTTYSITGNYSVSITSADFDQDGKIDLAVASGNTSNVLIFFNNGDGTFASGVSYPNPSNIDNNEIVAADANHDGKIDIIGSNFYGGVNTYTNLGGTFDAGVTSPYPYGGGYIWKSAISVNDFNNDGYPDAAVSIGDSSVIVIYPNDKNGNFGAGTSFPSPTTSIYDITSGDFNGDNKADIATVTVGTWRMVVHLNNGDGTFSTGTTYPCSYYPYAVKTADVNSDGKLDIITANNNINTISVFLNNGDGTFSSTPTSYSNMATEPVDLDTADLDGNGIVDIVTSSRNYPNPVITVFKNNSTPILFTSASGSIGIGTTNPLYKLEVVGAAHIMSGFATISESFTGATFPPNGFTTGIGTSGFARDTSTYYSSPASTTANSSGGTLPDGAITWLETGVTMPSTGYLNFQWKVSSESSCDYLVICIDRVTCDRNNYDDRIAGSVGWTTKSLPLSSGNHTIRWAYSKDGSVSSGSDTGWVDNISFESGVEASLFVDDSIGIGTTSPLGKLHVANGNAIFEGYVGIGTTNPKTNLELVGDATGFMSTSSEKARRNIYDPVTTWVDTGSTLPIEYLRQSHLAIIGNNIYLFGGSRGGNLEKRIFTAPISNPTSWAISSGTLPSAIMSSQVKVINDYVYLFGGSSGGSTNIIYRAPLSNPTAWTNTGSTLPANISDSQSAIVGDYVYLFGGNGSKVIYRAPLSNPTAWTDTGSTLPSGSSSLYNSSLSVINDSLYLFGGYKGGVGKVIYSAPLSNPTAWTDTGSTLPGNLANSQSLVIGDYVYLVGGYNGIGYSSPVNIYRAPLSNPTVWTDTGVTAPMTTLNTYSAQSAVIGDNVYLFGGGLSNVIFRAGIKGASEESNTAKYAPNANKVYNQTLSTLIFTDGMGNIGIGTTAPRTNLELVGEALGFITTSSERARRDIYSPLTWMDTGATLPQYVSSSQSAIIGNYVYLFGGSNSGTRLNTIYKAPLSKPASWTNTGSTLPDSIQAASSAIVGDYIYLFGGYNASSIVKTIFRAPISNPTFWTNTGSTLPSNLASPQIDIIGDYVYMFGGSNGAGSTNTIFSAPISNPASWTNTGSTLPVSIRESQSVIIGNYIYFFGGYGSTYLKNIYRAPLNNPTSWVDTGSTIPTAVTSSTSIVIGDYVYLLGGQTVGNVYTNKIQQAPLSNPTNWIDTGSTLPAVYGSGQVNVIGDYVYLIGGYNGGTSKSIYRAGIKGASEESNTAKYAPNADKLYNQTLYSLFSSDGMGNISLGNTNPIDKLEVHGFGVTGPSNPAIKLAYNLEPTNYYSRMYLNYNGSGDPNKTFLGFQVHSWPSTLTYTPLVLTGAGYVGIGTTNPTQLLTLNGSAGGAAGIYLNSAVPSSTSYTLYNNAGTLMWNGLALATGGGSISGTTNYIPKYTSASTLGNSIMTDTGYINIAGLAVIGNVSGNNYNENLRLPESSTGWSSIAIGATAGTSGTGVGQWNIVRAPSSWNYLFSVRYNSTDVFAINTSENVGIGTTNPYKKLDINGAGSASVWDGQLTVRDSQTFGLGTGGGIEFGGQFGTNLYNPDLAFIKSYKENATDGNYSFSLVFGTRANGANPAEVMRLTSAGKVGIGTTAPLAKLEVKASGYDVLKLTNPNSGGSSWMFGIWDSGLGGPTNTLSIGYSGANGGGVGGGSTYNLMNLDTSGFVGIAGSLKMTGQLYVGTGFTGAPGQVLVSTGVGLSWASASGSSTTTTNGLSLISSAVGLGGTLTQNTNIGTSSFGLTFSTPSGAIALHIGNSGAVGIGTTNPFAPFHIERNWSGTDLVGTLINNTGTGTGTAGSINFGLSGALTGKIQNIIDPSGTTTSLAFSNFYGGALKETMRLYNGFVGIGTSSPITPLDVGITSSATVSSVTIPDLSANLIGSITATSFYDSNNPKYYVNPASIGENSNSLSLTEGGSIKFNVASAGTTSVYIAAASAARIQNLNNGLALGTGDSNSIGIGNTITWNNQLFLNYNGNIGLGTTNPNKLLEVYNNTLNTGNPTIRISADANSNYTDATGKLGALEFYNNYSTNLGLAAAIQAGRGEGVVASGELHFLTSASSGTLADRMTIDKDGHVGIGTTRPIYPLHVVSADAVVFTNTTTGNWAQNLTLFTPNLPTGSASASFSFGLSDTAYNRAYVGFKNVGTGSTLNFMTFGFHSSDYLLNIKADGNVGINNTNPTTRLDIVGTSNSGVRLKQGGQINPGSLSTTFYSGLTFENDSTTNSYSMGYSTNGYFGLNYFNGTSTYSNLLTLTNTGNFGIGTTVPKALFQVGTEVGGTGPVFTVNSNGRVGIGITSALTRPFQIQEFGYSIFMGGTGLSLGANIFTDTTFNIGTTTNSSLAFYTNNTKRASFDGNGKFTIDTGRLNFGTTATTSSIPTMTAGDMMIGTSNTVNLATSGRIWIRVGTTRYTFRSSSITAGDYSEYFHQSTPSEEGDLMVISSEQSPISDTGQVEKSSRANQTKLIGVVSNAIRGTSYNDPEENRGFNPEFANVGLLGHVYTKVCTENGNILPGDRLTSSSIPGVAMRATQASEIVGYATESYSESDPTKIKKIMVYVSPQYFDPALESDSITNNQFNINYQIPESALSYLGYLGTKNQIENAIYTLKNNANQVVTKIGQFAQIATAKIKASLVSTTNLIAENIVGKKIITQEIVSPVGNIDHLASLNIQTTSLTAQNIETEKLTAQEASVSTLYADNIISHEGSFGEIMSNKISSLRDEMKNIIAARVASESAILAQSHDWTADIATDSARLTGDLALSDNLVVGAKLMVNGDTQLASAFISGTFTAGQVAIKDNIIETTNTALYIQPSKIGSVHIMGDTLVIADNGNIEINANVTVHGSLFANLLKADEIETNKLTSAEVVSNQLKIATDSAQTIIASDTDINLATDSAKLTSNATAGTATLPAGKTELIISTNKLSSSSMVYLTPVGSTNNQVIYVKNKITDSNPYFTIALDQPLDHEVSINWWIIN